MEFQKYQHVERFGTTEVEGIEYGDCYIFPKLDGTNASVWFNSDKIGEHEVYSIHAGSRKRELGIGADNAGFYDWVRQQDNLKEFFEQHPNIRLFGEWLVPHSLKTYRDDAWRKFYVFDVITQHTDDEYSYMTYDQYKPILEQYGIDYIPAIAKITNGSYDQFVNWLDKNTFLIKDGAGFGEGIVIKNYEFVNRFGRTTWAKIVTSEFKEKHAKTMGATEVKGKKIIESEIADQYITKALCDKVKAKIELDRNGFSSVNIPQLLNTVYYDLITEESWNFVKKFKNPTINYKTLKHFVQIAVKKHLPEIFGQ